MAKKVETGFTHIRDLENQLVGITENLVAITEKLDSIDTSETVAKTDLGGEPYVVQNYNFPSRAPFTLAKGWPSKKFTNCNTKEIYRNPGNTVQKDVTLQFDNMGETDHARVFVDDSTGVPTPAGGKLWKKKDSGLGQPISGIGEGKSVYIHFMGDGEVEISWHVS